MTAKYMADKGVEVYNKMPIRFGRMRATVYGGPFKEYVPGQRRLVSVKMAQEVTNPADISVPSQDFGVPTHPEMHAGIRKALQAILDGNDLYVGCGYGIGRTGTFMACLVKVMWAYYHRDDSPVRYLMGEPDDPITYVRRHYLAQAVETASQANFIDEFEVESHVQWLERHLKPQVIEKVVEVEKVRTVYTWNPFLAWMSMFDKRR